MKDRRIPAIYTADIPRPARYPQLQFVARRVLSRCVYPILLVAAGIGTYTQSTRNPDNSARPHVDICNLPTGSTLHITSDTFLQFDRDPSYAITLISTYELKRGRALTKTSTTCFDHVGIRYMAVNILDESGLITSIAGFVDIAAVGAVPR